MSSKLTIEITVNNETDSSMTEETNPATKIRPRFTAETARAKVQDAEDGWSGPKTFQAKSNLAMGAILTTVYGVYFPIIMGRVSAEPVADISWRPLMMITIVTVIILTIVTHAVIAIVATREAGSGEERGRAIEFGGDGIGGIVLAVGVFGGLALTVLDADVFWIAQALLGALVLSEIANRVRDAIGHHRAA